MFYQTEFAQSGYFSHFRYVFRVAGKVNKFLLFGIEVRIYKETLPHTTAGFCQYRIKTVLTLKTSRSCCRPDMAVANIAQTFELWTCFLKNKYQPALQVSCAGIGITTNH